MRVIKAGTHKSFNFLKIYCKSKLYGLVTFVGDFNYQIENKKTLINL